MVRSEKIAFVNVVLVLWSVLMNEEALAEIEQGWAYWRDGDILQAQNIAAGILKIAPTDQAANHLQGVTLYAQGRYKAALVALSKLDSSYGKYLEAGGAMVQAYLHLNDLEQAVQLARRLDLGSVAYLEDRLAQPFLVGAEQSAIIPFSDDGEISAAFWPGIAGRINGQEVNIRFDTGANYLVIGKDQAEKLGLVLAHEGKSTHAATEVRSWKGIAARMEFGAGVYFENIPVVIMESLGSHIIFGTNILEQFLATMDYPNARFILTPRHRKDLYPAHFELLSPRQKKLPFYMWGDHYMFAKGSFKASEDLTFFFDSGLVVLTEIDGKLQQAAFTASKESLLSWGFNENQLGKTTCLPTEHPLEVAGLRMENTLVWYDANLVQDRNFGGVRMDGLVSHGFLSRYSWTIDFDKHEYIFAVE